MQLDQIAIKLRPRSGFEAVDLGFRLAMRWWRSAFLAWWLPVLPLAIALHLGFAHNPIIAVLILWWLKPLFDRFVLYSLSRRVFGQPTSAADLLGAWRQIISPGLLYALTLARLDPARSYNLPVSILERQSGAPARRRRALLGRRFYGTAFGLTLVCINLELILQVGLGATVGLFLTPGGDPLDDSGPPLAAELISGQWWGIEDSIYYLLAIGLIEPLYVAAGFSLYLNRRVLLEGWDVELAIKRLAARLAAPLAAVLLIGASTLLPFDQARAHDYGDCLPNGELYFGQAHHQGEASDDDTQADAAEIDAEAEDWDPRDDYDPAYLQRLEQRCAAMAGGPQDSAARKAIVKVFDDPIFGERVTEERWVWRDSDEDEERDLSDSAPLAGLGQLLASIWQVLAWLILAGIVLMLIRYIARSWNPGTRPESDAGAAPAELFGLQMDPDSLPEQISQTAREWIAEGKLREALALLYRASLSELVHRHDLRLNRGATEGDVLTRTRGRVSAAASDYLGGLIARWVDLAYAEHAPQTDALLALCDGYAAHFEQPQAASAAPIEADPDPTQPVASKEDQA